MEFGNNLQVTLKIHDALQLQFKRELNTFLKVYNAMGIAYVLKKNKKNKL